MAKTASAGKTAPAAETLAPNAFIGKTSAPDDADLARALGSTKPLWDQIVAVLEEEHGVAIREWNSYSPKAGWALRLKRKKRTIVWMSPCNGCFRVTFILGGKAVAAAQQSKLSSRVLRMIDEAPQYPEGRGIRFQVDGPKEIIIVKQLAQIKLEN